MGKMTHKFVKIGAVAHKTGMGVETIRYYEKIGILPQPDRAINRYRLYGDDHIRRLFFIKRCRELGFSLETVRSLLALADDSHRTCDQVRDVAQVHLRGVKERIEDLHNIESALQELISSCEGGPSPECTIIETLRESSVATT